MKLQDVTFIDTVNEPGTTTPQSRFTSERCDLVFEAGIVTATKGPHVRMIPVGNVRFMTPAAKPSK